MVTRIGVSNINSPHCIEAGMPIMNRDPLTCDSLKTWDTSIDGAGEKVGAGHIDTGTTKIGIYDGMAENFIFNRVWVVPNEVNARFVVSDTTETINIWNAYERTTKIFTAVSAYNPTGTAITHPVLPYNLLPTADLNIKITVYKTGPSIQNTIYNVVVGGVSYPIIVKGIRILALARTPNFIDAPSLLYVFETSVFQTERMKEQRRTLRDIPLRTLKGQYLIYGEEGEELVNKIIYGHDKLFGVPIIDEALIPTTINTGGKTISLSNSTADKYNFLNWCSYIGIYEPDRNRVEIHEVDSYTANTITTINNIENVYEVSKTTIYPIFFGVIKSVDISEETSSVNTANVEYQEMRINPNG